MDTNKIFIDIAQRAREFAEMCERMANETKQKADPEAWREEYRKKQAAGVRFQNRCGCFWQEGNWNFEGNKEDYREVPQESVAPQDDPFAPTSEDGHDCEGFPGGCNRFGCAGGDKCDLLINPAIGVISSFNKWDRALTEKEISDLFSGKVRPEDIPQEAPKVAATGIEPTPPTPHAAERALWKAQREAGTNEVWQARNMYDHGPSNWADLSVYTEPQWAPKAEYRVKPMKLTAKIIRRGVYKTSYCWEFTGTREEYRAECEKYGYVILSEIKEVKPKTVKYYFALYKTSHGYVTSISGHAKDWVNEWITDNGHTIIGDIEEREIEA